MRTFFFLRAFRVWRTRRATIYRIRPFKPHFCMIGVRKSIFFRFDVSGLNHVSGPCVGLVWWKIISNIQRLDKLISNVFVVGGIATQLPKLQLCTLSDHGENLLQKSDFSPKKRGANIGCGTFFLDPVRWTTCVLIGARQLILLVHPVLHFQCTVWLVRCSRAG